MGAGTKRDVPRAPHAARTQKLVITLRTLDCKSGCHPGYACRRRTLLAPHSSAAFLILLRTASNGGLSDDRVEQRISYVPFPPTPLCSPVLIGVTEARLLEVSTWGSQSVDVGEAGAGAWLLFAQAVVE